MLEIQDLGLQPYSEIWALQKSTLEQRAAGQIPDQLLLTEHPPVYTLGRRFQPENLLDPGDVPVIAIERGGDITFHEPGQLVVYPIFLLTDQRRDLRGFLNGLEQVLINTLAEFGFTAERDSRNTGVWIQGFKVASIGIAVRRWVTWHGLALNINNDLALTQNIRPCGFDAVLMRSLQQLKGEALDIAKIKQVLIEQIYHWWQPK